MATEQPRDSQRTGDGPPLRSVKPDIVCLDGHQFRINYDVPQEVTDQLETLFMQDSEVKYDDIPDHLKAYEVEIDDPTGRPDPAAASSQ